MILNTNTNTSPDSFSMCSRCPNRLLASQTRSQGLLFAGLQRALGNESIAAQITQDTESQARDIESKGCPWFWPMTYKSPDGLMSQTVSDCGVIHLAHGINAQGALVKEALETVQTRTNSAVTELQDIKVRLSSGLAQGFQDLVTNGFNVTIDQIPSYAAGGRRDLPGLPGSGVYGYGGELVSGQEIVDRQTALRERLEPEGQAGPGGPGEPGEDIPA